VFFAAWYGTVFTAAVAVAVVASVFGYVYIFMALRGYEGRARAAGGVFFWPVTLGGLACGAGWSVSTLLPGGTFFAEVIRLGVICSIAIGIYVPAIRIVEPVVCREVVDRTMKIVKRRRGRRERADTPGE
ncbi:MAG: hypothetical protein K8E66_10830, partial [Phycisphaerales bacterium]|nr:hypothetical protein [Phycisphaerales bacterium]